MRTRLTLSSRCGRGKIGEDADGARIRAQTKSPLPDMRAIKNVMFGERSGAIIGSR
jgi:hypothetical protein